MLQAVLLTSRQADILKAITEENVKTGMPVGSAQLEKAYKFGLSTATIRNEMQSLEHAGLIMQPHTSAGRIPTEAGWRYYLERHLDAGSLQQKKQQLLKDAYKGTSAEEKIKALVKRAAELSGETLVVGFAPFNVFYTGVSNLFSKPEFHAHERVLGISSIIDHLDEVMSRVHQRLDNDISILLGSDNPFGTNCGCVLTLAQLDGATGVIGILGPIRMDYRQNVAFIKYIKQLLEREYEKK